MKISLRILFASMCLGIISINVEADDSRSNIFSGYKVDLGISVKQLDFDVYDSGSSDTNGTLTEGMDTTYFFGLGSPYSYFSEEGNSGYYIEYGFSNFDMDEQEVDLEEVNLRTRVRGEYLYVTPMVFYQFGERGRESENHHSLIVGIGAGLGYLQSEGNIVFTEEPTNPVHDFDVSGFGLAVNIVLDYRVKNWMVRIRGGGPSITKNDFDYDIFEFSLDFGYSITL